MKDKRQAKCLEQSHWANTNNGQAPPLGLPKWEGTLERSMEQILIHIDNIAPVLATPSSLRCISNNRSKNNFMNTMNTKTCALIESLLPSLETPCFRYGKPIEVQQSVEAFLSLWTYVLQVLSHPMVKNSPLRYRRCCLRVIVAILRRMEFSLNYLSTKHCFHRCPAHGNHITPHCAYYTTNIALNEFLFSHGSEYIKKYKALLYTSLSVIVRFNKGAIGIRREQGSPQHEPEDCATSARPKPYTSKHDRLEEYEYVAEITSFAFFRLPGTIQNVIVNVIRTMVSQKAYCFPRSARHPYTVEKMLFERLDCILPRCNWNHDHKTFTDNNPTLFMWCWVDVDLPEDRIIEEEILFQWLYYLMHDVIFVNQYVRAVSEHVYRACRGESQTILWATIPAYRHLLRLYIPILHRCYVWMAQRLNEPPAAFNDSVDLELAKEKDPCPPKIEDRFPMTPSSCRIVYETSNILLYYQPVFDIWMRLVFENTNAHNPSVVSLCIERLKLWLNVFNKNCSDNMRLSMNGFNGLHWEMDEKAQLSKAKTAIAIAVPLDHEYFLRALGVLFESDHFEVLKTGLDFLYYYLNTFEEDLRYEIATRWILHPDMFYKFFFHWSKDIRQSYHLLTVFKLFRHQRSQLNLSSDSLFDIGKDICPAASPTSSLLSPFTLSLGLGKSGKATNHSKKTASLQTFEMDLKASKLWNELILKLHFIDDHHQFSLPYYKLALQYHRNLLKYHQHMMLKQSQSSRRDPDPSIFVLPFMVD